MVQAPSLNTLMRTWMALGILMLMLLAPVPVLAVEPNEMLADPVMEARARELSKGLRCVVCRNQSIDDSNAGIARDLRIALRERISSGDSDTQAVAYLVDRFGSYILLKPPFQMTTYLLWIGPLLMLMAAFFGFRSLWRNSDGPPDMPDAISPDDQALIARILDQKD